VLLIKITLVFGSNLDNTCIVTRKQDNPINLMLPL
jgi:hypothetical protein